MVQSHDDVLQLFAVASGAKRFRHRNGEVLAEIDRFAIIGLLVLDDDGATSHHLQLFSGIQRFDPS